MGDVPLAVHQMRWEESGGRPTFRGGSESTSRRPKPRRRNHPLFLFRLRITQAENSSPDASHTWPWLPGVCDDLAPQPCGWPRVRALYLGPWGSRFSVAGRALLNRRRLRETLVSPSLSRLATSAVNRRPCKVYSLARPSKRVALQGRRRGGSVWTLTRGRSRGLAAQTSCTFTPNRFRL